jgi:hypothetical protein
MSKNKKSRPIAPKAKPETARQSAARLSAGAPNRRRADQAYVALAAFSAMCGIEQDDLGTQVSDLIADLMHMARAADLDWISLHARARGHFETECSEEFNVAKARAKEKRK